MAERFWTCRRKSDGIVCGYVNPRRKLLCEACGKQRPKTKRPAHMTALDIPYERYVEINGGARCGICGKPPSEKRRLDRDHEHKGDGGDGCARGLLCAFPCNTGLKDWMTPQWLRQAAYYLERHEERRRAA